jgi:glutathione synthase/RimK-type ligase-like ATP-grasp enzyme
MILLLTRFANDPSVVRLHDILSSSGDDPVIVALTDMEARSSCVMISDDQNGEMACTLIVHDRHIRLADVRAAWLWRSWRPQDLEDRFRDIATNRHAWTFFENEWQAFYKGVSLALAGEGVFCVNPPPFNSAFEEKIAQMLVASNAGLRVPSTLYTTRLEAARHFLNAQGGSMIYKPFRAHIEVHEGASGQPARARRLLTNRVQPADLVESENFLPTPSIFQPYIPKAFELRIVVVGQQLFACAIDSQRSPVSREDWRRYDIGNTPYRPYDLPPEISAKLRIVMDRLGLVFGSIDLIVTPEGEYVFLEVNPNGQFDWVARLTKMPIYEHLAAMLRAGSARYSIETIGQFSHAK